MTTTAVVSPIFSPLKTCQKLALLRAAISIPFTNKLELISALSLQFPTISLPEIEQFFDELVDFDTKDIDASSTSSTINTSGAGDTKDTKDNSDTRDNEDSILFTIEALPSETVTTATTTPEMIDTALPDISITPTPDVTVDTVVTPIPIRAPSVKPASPLQQIIQARTPSGRTLRSTVNTSEPRRLRSNNSK